MNKTIKKDIQEELKEKSLARITKEIRRETKTKKKLAKKAAKETGLEKTETQAYIDTINEKLLLLLGAITADKVKGSNLASISKAFRSILGQRDAFLENESKEPNKSLNINLNIDNLSEQDILKMLSDHSNKQDAENI